MNLHRGKGDVLERENYLGLKFMDQVLKLLERVLDSFIREIVEMDYIQFGFLGRGTTDAIFIIHQLQEEKYIAANKPLYFAFVDLEKAFDHVPRNFLWALKNYGVKEWAVRVIQCMYTDVRSRVRVNGQYTEEFGVGVRVHQGSAQPLAFHTYAESSVVPVPYWLSRELLYADDRVVMADPLEECIAKLKAWKEGVKLERLSFYIK